MKRQSGLTVVFEFWRRRPLFVLGLFFATALAAGVAIAFPYLLQLIVDGIKGAISGAQLVRYVVLLGIFGVLRALADSFLPFLRGRANERFAWDFRNRVFRQILEQGYRFARRFPSGDVMERLDHDMVELSWFACSGIFRFIAAAAVVLFSLVMLLRMNILLTLVTVLPASMAVVGWMRMGPKIYSWFMRWREKIAEVNNQLQAAFSGIRLVKSFVTETGLARAFRTTLDERIAVAVQEARVESRVQVFYMAIAEVALLLLLWVGGMFVIRGRLSLGEFVAFNAYIFLLLPPMFDIGNLFVTARRAAGAAERILALTREEGESPAGGKEAKPGTLRLEQVSFSYDNTPVLKSVTMEFPAGKKVGVAGTVGSGKSTVLRLILRLVEPDSGRVLLNGTDVRDYDIVSYRRLFGYAPQEPLLFSDTLRDNIVFGRDVKAEELEEVIALAQLAGDVKELPRGLDELLGERGTGLSGGQRARVAIARALIGKPPFLLFDDVTAALDADTENEFIRQLFQKLADRTLIVVSHRLAVLSACDHVYVLDRGELKEEGGHEELLKKEGLYWQLYQRQLLQEELERL